MGLSHLYVFLPFFLQGLYNDVTTPTLINKTTGALSVTLAE